MLQQLSLSNSQTGSVDSIRSQLSDVDAKYSQMDYLGALTSVLKAEDMAKSALSGAPITLAGGLSMGYPILGVAVGLVVGFLVAWMIFKRRAVKA
jgi:hypothetical protein